MVDALGKAIKERTTMSRKRWLMGSKIAISKIIS
jgi:hypothetical protein